MKQVIRKSLIIAASCLFLFQISCAKTTAPKCESEEVKKSLVEIVRKSATEYASKKNNSEIKSLEETIAETSKNCESYEKNFRAAATEQQANSPAMLAKFKEICERDAEELIKLRKTLDDLKKHNSQQLANINNFKIEITDVRTSSIDTKTGKQICACNLKFPDNDVIPITYTSELSDGGKNFYVNITSGL